MQPNQLVLTVQPDEGVSLSLGAKIPGPRMRIRPVNMEFRYGTSFLSESPEAYERLILDAMRGDATLFTREDEVAASWAICDPILKAWSATPGPLPDLCGRIGGTRRGGRAAAGSRWRRSNGRWRLWMERRRTSPAEIEEGLRELLRSAMPRLGSVVAPRPQPRRGGGWWRGGDRQAARAGGSLPPVAHDHLRASETEQPSRAGHLTAARPAAGALGLCHERVDDRHRPAAPGASRRDRGPDPDQRASRPSCGRPTAIPRPSIRCSGLPT